MKCKQSIALLLAGAMLLPANAFAADLSQFKDFPNDWSSQSLERAIDDGLLNGSNGQINAKGLLTRAQMAAIVARAFGAVKAASLSSYKDVLPSAWYYSDMGKAVQMQAFQGADGLLHPNDPITREEAFTVLARAFALADGSSSALSAFSDSASVSSWAKGSVAALVENGYVDGANGRLNPKNNITRAEFAKVITGMAASYVGSETVSGKTVDGNMIVRESGATLSNVTINGDLIIADSADKVSLENVKVTGRIVIRGGASSVSATNTTAGKGVLVDSPNGSASLSVSGGSIGTVNVKSDLSLSGTVSNVTITDKATLTVEKDAKVDTVTVSAAGAKVTGSGKVDTVKANANNVTVSTSGTKVTAGSGVSGVKAGDKTVEAGKTETVGAASTATGGSSGGGSRHTTVAMTKLETAGNTYYYGKAASSGMTTFTVDGKTVSAQALAGTNVYFLADEENTDKTVYGTANVPYADFYYAELGNTVEETDTLDITGDAASAQRADGMYDAVSCATTAKSVKYTTSYNDIDADSTEAIKGHIYGVKTPVKLSADLYAKAYALGQCGQTGSNSLVAMVASIGDTLTETASTQYKEIYANGTLSAWQGTANEIDASSVTAALSSSTAWGTYQVDFTNFPSEINSQTNVLGVVLETSDGAKYALKHAENLWLQSQEFAFAAEAMTEPHGNQLGYQRFADIPGKTITKVTYLLNGYNNVTINTSLYCPKLLTADQKSVTAEVLQDFSNNGNAQVKLDLSKLPIDYQVKLDSVTQGARHGTALSTDAYSYNAATGVLTINHNDDNTYAIVISDAAENGYSSVKVSVELNSYTYAYASVPYDEYWKSEGVYLEGTDWTASDATLDNYNETDKGAFDAVSRATINHGLHRGSFQQDVVIHTADKDYHPVYWTDGNNFVDQDGTTYDKTAIGITSYNITGIKYVPVKVKTADFDAFCKAYTVTKNGETLAGGYTENNLSAYTGLGAAVDADTNGLKEVTKSNDGTFTFGARQSGTGSGIKDVALKTADSNIQAAAKTYSGSFGEMLRVDLDNTQDNTKYYGDLGSNMQTVVWKYYGDGDTVLATYGTKFAADDWMHKSMGIQLGLTDSKRFKLPEGTDGTGKWTLTIYALGYSDATYEVNVTADNLPKAVEPMTEAQKTQLENLRDQAKELLEAAKDPNNPTPAETTLKSHYDEIVALLADKDATKAAADELIQEVPGYITAVENERAAEPTTKAANGEATVTMTDDKYVDGSYQAKVTVTFDSDGKVISVVDNGTEPGDTNSSYWTNATAMFQKLIGKTSSEIDDVDAVSKATVSSNAIKNAVKNALSSSSNN